jgi:hypothetical protein
MPLYTMLYSKFAGMQDEPASTPRLLYPAGGVPFLAVAEQVTACAVGVPELHERAATIEYGLFVLPNNGFGRYASARLVFASACLLGAKAPLFHRHRAHLEKWLASKGDLLRASWAANAALDALARKTITRAEGQEFYNDVVATADMLSCALLPKNPDVQVFIRSSLTIAQLGLHAPRLHLKTGNAAGRLEEVLRPLGSGGKKMWDDISPACDALYDVARAVPGPWHSIYLPYANSLPAGAARDEIFQKGLVARSDFEAHARNAGRTVPDYDGDAFSQDVFFEFCRDAKRQEKIVSRLARAARNANFGSFGILPGDYTTYHGLYVELSSPIRRMVEQARLVRNVLDENMFEESGNVDLQVAIQSIASETRRTDTFVRDEELLRNESWAVLVDSSLSLGGMGRELQSVALCIAEAAKEIIGANPWGMFAFSDDLYCIKDFTEPYDSLAKARIGALVPGGLSHIPDAIRTCRNMLVEHAKERNYIILVSDGLPSGYPGIEREFASSVRELRASGVALAAIGMGSGSIKKVIPTARPVSGPAEVARAFSEIYFSLSS